MHIKEICLEGFKSYATRTVVPGFDPYFNAITGLNGSGKSNILDSICFVLGITNLQQVRAANLQELVYKMGQAGITKATVSVVFDNSDPTRSPLGYENSPEITVTRQIIVGGRNKYLINGHVAQPSRVQNLFHSVQLNVNNPHFLIMQGRITKVLNMKPPEILSMLEEAAGTRMYETKKESALKTLEKKQSKVDEIDKLLDLEIVPALEKLRKERMQYMQWSNGNAELDRLKRFCIAYEYVVAEEVRDNAVEKVREIRSKIAEIDAEVGKMGEETQEMEKKVSELTGEKEASMGGEVKALSDKVDELSRDLVKEQSLLKNQVANLKAEKKNADQIEKGLEESKLAAKERAKAVKAAEDGAADLTRSFAELEKSLDANEKEYQGVVAGKGSGNEEKCLEDQLGDAKVAVGRAETELKQLQTKISHCEKELKEKNSQLLSTREKATAVEKELTVKRTDVEKVKKSLESISYDENHMEELQKDRSTVVETVQKLKDDVRINSSQLAHVDFSYRDHERNFDRSRVKGVVAKLIRVKDSSAVVALEVAAGGKLYNVVVDNENTGKQLLQNGGLRRRVTIIPMNKIKSNPVPIRVQNAASKLVGHGNAEVALSLVGYEKELQSAGLQARLLGPSGITALGPAFGDARSFFTETTESDVLSNPKNFCPTEDLFEYKNKLGYAYLYWRKELPIEMLLTYSNMGLSAMEYVFGSTFVCKTTDAAREVAFNRDIQKPSVTLEGDIFQPSGLLTGGSRRGGGELLRQLHALAEAEQKLSFHQKQLSDIDAKIGALLPLQRKFNDLKTQLELKLHDLSLCENRAQQNEHHKLSELVKRITEELEEAKSAVKEKKLLHEECVAKVRSLEMSIRDHAGNREGRLKDLEKKIKAIKGQMKAASTDFKRHESEKERLMMQMEEAEKEHASQQSQLAALRKQIDELTLEVKSQESKVASIKEHHDSTQSELKVARMKIKECDSQIASIVKEQNKIQNKISDANLEKKRLENEVKRMETEQKDCSGKVEKLLEKHAWIASEKQLFGKAGSDYDFASRNPQKARQDFEKLQAEQSGLEKRVNKKVMAMFEKAEDEYNDLISRKNIIENDKSKIKMLIEELDEKKKETLGVTWSKVNKDFGSIFSTLLPGTMAKLEPPEGGSFLDGLEVRVAFGSVWKQSLSELSGGQRSLLALSLILALLLFKPAPLYILDEVDAALDLSHTQNIGRMIKTHFPHSQFIVVSLKEGMFNNANVLFRTKFVDGVSTVQRTVTKQSK